MTENEKEANDLTRRYDALAIVLRTSLDLQKKHFANITDYFFHEDGTLKTVTIEADGIKGGEVEIPRIAIPNILEIPKLIGIQDVYIKPIDEYTKDIEETLQQAYQIIKRHSAAERDMGRDLERKIRASIGTCEEKGA